MTQHKQSPSDVVPIDTVSVKNTHKAYNTVFQGYPDILDVKHVSELLNVSTKTVYRLLNDGALASLKVGRAFKIPKLYLLQYIKVMGYTQQQG
jgi:excisionase family DNA binding protein